LTPSQLRWLTFCLSQCFGQLGAPVFTLLCLPLLPLRATLPARA
jgi:hypothetical protein